MIDVSRKGRSRAIGALVAFATVVLAAGPSAQAAAPGKNPVAKPAQAGLQAKSSAPRSVRTGPAGTGQGIVQSISARAVVLRELDGSTVSVPVAPSTHVFVDGKQAALGDVKPGFVAVASWKADKPARKLQVFDLSRQNAVKVAAVESVSTHAVVVTEAGGSSVTIRVNAKTRILVDGKPATLGAVKDGDTVVFSAQDSKGNKPAGELRFLRPG